MLLTSLPSPSEARGNFLNALRCGKPGPVPYFDFAFSKAHIARLLGPHVIEQWPQQRLAALHVPPEWYVELALKLRTGFVQAGFVWELGRVYHRTEEGEECYQTGSIRSPEDLDTAQRPALEPILRRLASFIELGRRHETAVGWCVYGPVIIAQLAMGLEEFCLALHQNPDLVRRLCAAAVEFYTPLVAAACRAGIDFLLLSEGLCMKSGPMFRPNRILEFWRPALRELLAPARAAGIPIGIHSDGNNTTFVDDFLEAGFTFLHPVEPCDGSFDIYDLQKKVAGRLALAGNIDLCGVLSKGTPEQVRADVEEHIRRLGPSGGYLCGSSHEISDAVPPENFHSLVQAVHDFRTLAIENSVGPSQCPVKPATSVDANDGNPRGPQNE